MTITGSVTNCVGKLQFKPLPLTPSPTGGGGTGHLYLPRF